MGTVSEILQAFMVILLIFQCHAAPHLKATNNGDQVSMSLKSILNHFDHSRSLLVEALSEQNTIPLDQMTSLHGNVTKVSNDLEMLKETFDSTHLENQEGLNKTHTLLVQVHEILADLVVNIVSNISTLQAELKDAIHESQKIISENQQASLLKEIKNLTSASNAEIASGIKKNMALNSEQIEVLKANDQELKSEIEEVLREIRSRPSPVEPNGTLTFLPLQTITEAPPATTSAPTTTTEATTIMPSLDLGCDSKRFQCLSIGQGELYCAPNRWKCDGARDCLDVDDEANCTNGVEPVPVASALVSTVVAQTCDQGKFWCIRTRNDEAVCAFNFWKCDGERDCSNVDDEADCQRTTITTTMAPTTTQRLSEMTCGSTEFLCNFDDEFTCVRNLWKCDGVRDCINVDDEADCPASITTVTEETSTTSSVVTNCGYGEFLCHSRTYGRLLCAPNRWKCDGEIDCLNIDDEANCSKRGMKSQSKLTKSKSLKALD